MKQGAAISKCLATVNIESVLEGLVEHLNKCSGAMLDISTPIGEMPLMMGFEDDMQTYRLDENRRVMVQFQLKATIKKEDFITPTKPAAP